MKIKVYRKIGLGNQPVIPAEIFQKVATKKDGKWYVEEALLPTIQGKIKPIFYSEFEEREYNIAEKGVERFFVNYYEEVNTIITTTKNTLASNERLVKQKIDDSVRKISFYRGLFKKTLLDKDSKDDDLRDDLW